VNHLLTGLGIAALLLLAGTMGLCALIFCAVLTEIRELRIVTGHRAGILSKLLRHTNQRESSAGTAQESHHPWADDLPPPLRLDPEGIETRKAELAAERERLARERVARGEV